jgi:hypothetical protein
MAAHDAQQVRECMDKFSALEIEMATVQAELKPLKEAVTNFRNLDRNVTEFMSEFRTHRNDEERRAQYATDAVREALKNENSRRNRLVLIIGIIISALMLMVAILQLHREWKETHIQTPVITKPHTTSQLNARVQSQEAINQRHYALR